MAGVTQLWLSEDELTRIMNWLEDAAYAATVEDWQLYDKFANELRKINYCEVRR